LPSLSTPPAPTQISPLSLHDALPILWPAPGAIVPPSFTVVAPTLPLPPNVPPAVTSTGPDNEPSTINVPPATVVLPRNRELSPVRRVVPFSWRNSDRRSSPPSNRAPNV